MTNNIARPLDCPKPGCGYSADGTPKQARARLLMHANRADHAATLRALTRFEA